MSNKPQRKKIEGQEVLTHDEVFNQPKQEQSEPWKGDKVESIVKDDFDPDITEDLSVFFAQVHALTAKVHNLQGAFDNFKNHTQQQMAQFAKELKSASLDVPANVTGQGTLKAESELKYVASLGRQAKESVNDPLKDTAALKMVAIEAQEAYLRKTVDPGEIQFLNQSLASLRKL